MNNLRSSAVARHAAAAAVVLGFAAAVAAAPAHAATTNGGASLNPTTTPIATTKAATPAPRASHLACAGIGFTVLHDDRSGGLVLPAGAYRVSSPTLSCHAASADFTSFLDRYQGRIPGWTGTQLGRGYGTYADNGSGASFTVRYVG